MPQEKDTENRAQQILEKIWAASRKDKDVVQPATPAPPSLHAKNIAALKAMAGVGSTGNLSGAQSVSSGPQYNPEPAPVVRMGDWITVQSRKGVPIVRIDPFGEVIWDAQPNETEAAEALRRSFRISTEMAAGVTETTKMNIRNSVFEEILSVVQKHGTINEEQLTFLWEGAKIMDKLKGTGEK